MHEALTRNTPYHYSNAIVLSELEHPTDVEHTFSQDYRYFGEQTQRHRLNRALPDCIHLTHCHRPNRNNHE